jgi:hypothetical protein
MYRKSGVLTIRKLSKILGMLLLFRFKPLLIILKNDFVGFAHVSSFL